MPDKGSVTAAFYTAVDPATGAEVSRTASPVAGEIADGLKRMQTEVGKLRDKADMAGDDGLTRQLDKLSDAVGRLTDNLTAPAPGSFGMMTISNITGDGPMMTISNIISPDPLKPR